MNQNIDIQQETDRCVKCGLCLAVCPTYSLFRNEAESPRGRLALMENNSLSAKGIQHINNCLLCKRCESSCPSGVSVTQAIIEYRKQNKTTSIKSRFLQLLSEQLLTSPSLAPVFNLGNTGKLKKYSQQGETLEAQETLKHRPQLLLIPGCATSQITPETVKKSVILLNKSGYSTEVLDSPLCCGALFAHHGKPAQADHLLKQISNKRHSTDYHGVIHLASGCSNFINSQTGKDSIDSIFPFLLSAPTPLKFIHSDSLKVAIHTPCSSSQQSTQQIMTLLKKIPNLQIQVIPEMHGCCGAAGSFMLTNPKVSKQLRQPIAEHIQQSNYDIVISANIGCALHLQAGLPDIKLMHPIDLLFKYSRPLL